MKFVNQLLETVLIAHIGQLDRQRLKIERRDRLTLENLGPHGNVVDELEVCDFSKLECAASVRNHDGVNVEQAESPCAGFTFRRTPPTGNKSNAVLNTLAMLKTCSAVPKFVMTSNFLNI